ncbi:MAG: rhomboid family intramembrane serine protease [Alphaproteobacteria bacterium]|nr:rhomboid family intramembrane serine protease [Alphaproteobacteria bacterium]
MTDRTSEPAINLPPYTLALVAANVLLFVGLSVLSDDARWTAIDLLGFVPGRYSGTSALSPVALIAPVSYQFIHGDWVHLTINMVSLAAFGAGVERQIGGGTMVSVYLLCGVLAAAAHLAVYPESIEPVIGASGAISGLMAGILLLLRSTRAAVFRIAIVWGIAMTALGILGMPGSSGTQIAWVAHLGGFVGGLILFRIFVGSERQ